MKPASNQTVIVVFACVLALIFAVSSSSSNIPDSSTSGVEKILYAKQDSIAIDLVKRMAKTYKDSLSIQLYRVNVFGNKNEDDYVVFVQSNVSGDTDIWLNDECYKYYNRADAKLANDGFKLVFRDKNRSIDKDYYYSNAERSTLLFKQNTNESK